MLHVCCKKEKIKKEKNLDINFKLKEPKLVLSFDKYHQPWHVIFKK